MHVALSVNHFADCSDMIVAPALYDRNLKRSIEQAVTASPRTLGCPLSAGAERVHVCGAHTHTHRQGKGR
jgi:hypothetical protein